MFFYVSEPFTVQRGFSRGYSLKWGVFVMSIGMLHYLELFVKEGPLLYLL